MAAAMKEVKRLRALYPTYKIMCSGHSLGAAQATIAALDFYAAGLASASLPIHLYTFGSPRIGNQEFADWGSNLPNLINERGTHYKDIVPHNPWSQLGFVHLAGEVYENLNTGGQLYACVGEEDNQCSYYWGATYWSISNHLLYRGLVMGSGGCAYV